MVAARPANLLADVRLASGVGELLLGPSQIESPRWRCDAIARIAPALVQHGIVIDRLRAQLREGLRAAPCPAPLRDELGELLLGRLADAKPEALARIVPHALPARDREQAIAHLARLDPRRVRSLATASARSGAYWWIARDLMAAGRFDDARAIAGEIEAPLLRQFAVVELARCLAADRRYADALFTLRDVREPRLAGPRHAVQRVVLLCLRDPVRYIQREREELQRTAWQPAAWLRPLDTVRQDAVTTAIYFARAGWRLDDYFLHQDGARLLAKLAHDPIARRDASALAHQVGLPVLRVLSIGQCLSRGLDAFVAEELARQARDLELAPPFREGLAAATPPTDDPRSLARALYDEGLALSPHAPRRRRVLIAAAQHCLRAALAQPADWSAAALEVRLRTLVHLGGSLAADAIAKAVATLPFEAELVRMALAHHALLDPRRE